MSNPRRAWTPSEVEDLERMYGKVPVKEIARSIGRTVPSIENKARRLGLVSNLSGNQFTSAAVDSRVDRAVEQQKQGNGLQDLWTAIYAFQKAALDLDTEVDEADFNIETDKPIAVAFLADAHIGAITCKYEDLVKRFELMEKTEGLYIASVGDSVDNYLPQKHAAGMFAQLIPPEIQKQLVENLYSKMKGRWIGVVQGCHDDFSKQTDDFDWTKYLAKHLECNNLGFGGFINLNVGEVGYRLCLRHKFRGNSAKNLTATVKRMREELGDFDVGCVAHHHQAAVEQVIHTDGVDRVFIRPGSFKGADRYAKSLGYKDTGSYIPTVVFFPKKRMMIPFLHLEQAAEFLGSVR